MNQYTITLKNLYLILTVNDYPLYSDGVINKKYRTGTTLTSFWKSALVPEWRNGTYGEQLWKQTRSRYLSDFCNLRDVVPFYDEYRTEFLRSLSEELLLTQIGIFSTYLLTHSYNADVFFRKIRFMIDASQDSSFFTKQHCLFIMKHYNEAARQLVPEAFCDGWVFTVLTICAMCGNAAGVSQFMRIVDSEDYTPGTLFAHWAQMEKERLPIRHQSVYVYGAAVDAALFFGREKELYDLTEAVNHNRKVFLTGIGGIGKTELLRQLLSHVAKSRSRSNIVAIR